MSNQPEPTEFALEVLDLCYQAVRGFRRAIFVGPEYYERMRHDPYLRWADPYLGSPSIDNKQHLRGIEVVIVYPNQAKV